VPINDGINKIAYVFRIPYLVIMRALKRNQSLALCKNVRLSKHFYHFTILTRLASCIYPCLYRHKCTDLGFNLNIKSIILCNIAN